MTLSFGLATIKVEGLQIRRRKMYMYQFCCQFKRFALKIVVEDTRETIHRSE